MSRLIVDCVAAMPIVADARGSPPGSPGAPARRARGSPAGAWPSRRRSCARHAAAPPPTATSAAPKAAAGPVDVVVGGDQRRREPQRRRAPPRSRGRARRSSRAPPRARPTPRAATPTRHPRPRTSRTSPVGAAAASNAALQPVPDRVRPRRGVPRPRSRRGRRARPRTRWARRRTWRRARPGPNASDAGATSAPIGRPPPSAFASITTSGTTPAREIASQSPQRPIPDCTSSATRSAPRSVQSARAAWRYVSVSGSTPPSPITGSRYTAATSE